jgi:hypothetical protein
MEERLRLLEEALRQTMTALQDSQNRVTALEGGAGFPPQQPPPPPPSPANTSLVDMRMLGKPAMFSGDRENWRGWSFTMRAFAAALSGDLRQLMDQASGHNATILNPSLSQEKQRWSRQLYYMMSLTMNGDALRRLQSTAE